MKFCFKTKQDKRLEKKRERKMCKHVWLWMSCPWKHLLSSAGKYFGEVEKKVQGKRGPRMMEDLWRNLKKAILRA